MVQTLSDEGASAYRCTAQSNKIFKKRDAREAGLTVCPFERALILLRARNRGHY